MLKSLDIVAYRELVTKSEKRLYLEFLLKSLSEAESLVLEQVSNSPLVDYIYISKVCHYSIKYSSILLNRLSQYGLLQSIRYTHLTDKRKDILRYKVCPNYVDLIKYHYKNGSLLFDKKDRTGYT